MKVVAPSEIALSVRDLVYTALDGELTPDEREELSTNGPVAVKVWMAGNNNLRVKIVKTKKVSP